MMSADGKISGEERDVLKGALRNLSGDTVRSVHIEAMLDRAAEEAAEHGRDARLRDVVEHLHEDGARAEVAFVLAAAIAFADSAIADEENETLNLLAEGLGISEARADELLDSVESDLAERRQGLNRSSRGAEVLPVGSNPGGELEGSGRRSPRT